MSDGRRSPTDNAVGRLCKIGFVTWSVLCGFGACVGLASVLPVSETAGSVFGVLLGLGFWGLLWFFPGVGFGIAYFMFGRSETHEGPTPTKDKAEAFLSRATLAAKRAVDVWTRRTSRMGVHPGLAAGIVAFLLYFLVVGGWAWISHQASERAHVQSESQARFELCTDTKFGRFLSEVISKPWRAKYTTLFGLKRFRSREEFLDMSERTDVATVKIPIDKSAWDKLPYYDKDSFARRMAWCFHYGEPVELVDARSNQSLERVTRRGHIPLR